jgi:patatin-like phospholipase/acyl hydrolase
MKFFYVSFSFLIIVVSTLTFSFASSSSDDEEKELFKNTSRNTSSSSSLSSFRKDKMIDSKGEEEEDKEHEESDPIFVLSIDGGGIRGLIPATYLSFLENELGRSLKCGVRLAECIDVIAGTSTGGLIAVGLNIPNKFNTSPRYSAQDLANSYKSIGPRLFPQSNYFYRTYRKARSAVHSKFNRENIDDSVNELLETKDRKTTPLLRESFSTLMTFTYQANLGKFISLASFKNGDIPLKDAALATSAAPYYFDPYETENGNVYLDGGLIANNPSLNALSSPEVLESLKKGREIYLLSLGTGVKNTAEDYSRLDRISGIRMGGAALLRNFPNLLSLIMQGASQNTHELLGKFAQDGLQGRLNYEQVQFNITDDSFENTSRSNLGALESAAQEQFSSFRTAKVDKFIDALKEVCHNGKILKNRLKRYESNSSKRFLDLSFLPSPQLDDFTFYKYIRKLSLANTVRGPENAATLLTAFKGKFPELEVFDFSQNAIGGNLVEREEIWEGLMVSPSLKILILHSNGLNDEDIKGAGEFIQGLPLNSLDLSYNNVTVQGLKYLLNNLSSNLVLLNLVNSSTDKIKLSKDEIRSFDDKPLKFYAVSDGRVKKETFQKEFNPQEDSDPIHFILY